MIELTDEEINSIKLEIKLEKPYNVTIIQNSNSLLHKLNRKSVETALLFVNCVRLMRNCKEKKIGEFLKKASYVSNLIFDLETYYEGGIGKSDSEYKIKQIYAKNLTDIEDFIQLTQKVTGLFSVETKTEDSIELESKKLLQGIKV